MKVVIAGGSGDLGALIAGAFSVMGHEVVILSRRTSPPAAPGEPSATGVRFVSWDGRRLGDWAAEIDGAGIVVNLAGRTVNCRYSPKHRQEIVQSRVDSTRAIGEAIARAGRPPATWLQAATATIYSHRYDAPNDEDTGIIPEHEAGVPETWNFSLGVARSWEQALAEAPTLFTRKVALRISIVMSPQPGGAFDVMLGLVRRGLGGRAGDGRQYVSWIHQVDFLRAVLWVAAHPELSGAVNLASPGALPNAEFMRDLRRAWGIRFGLPAARWMLEIGALFLRTETELVLKSRRVAPARLLESGFTFQFPTWPAAAADLCANHRAALGHCQKRQAQASS